MLAAIVAVSLAAMGGPCSAGGEFEPPLCPTGLARVAEVRIEAQGVAIWQDADSSSCPGFRLDAAHVRRFFRGARRAAPRDVHFTLPESPCVVLGHVGFADGTGGRWSIDRHGLGWLDRPGRPRLTLYCRGCRTRPWTR